MEAIVRAIDVGFGNTKYVLAAQGGRVECAHFASIAYDSAHDNSNDALGSKRKTVCVPVGGMWYEVGPDVALAADGFVGRNHHDDYIRTPEYRAFTAAILSSMSCTPRLTESLIVPTTLLSSVTSQSKVREPASMTKVLPCRSFAFA